VSEHSRSDTETPMQHDVDLDFHGSVSLMTPFSEAARAWMDEHIPEDALWHGVSLVVEPRYAPAIVQGMIEDGLAVFSGDTQIVEVNP
jgi:hypothetical protein